MTSNTSKIIYIFALLLFITLSTLVYFARALFTSGSSITPLRWLVATLLPLAIIYGALKKKSLSLSGALLGIVMGFVLTLAHWAFLMSLLVFFVTSSKVTRFRQEEKRRIEGSEFKPGGQRNWVQVLCNGGVATQVALLYLLDIGSADLPVDFARYYRPSWLGMALLGALACSGGDTWASEIGSVFSKSDPVLITTFRRVPRGTNGGISLVGLLASVGGGLAVGMAYFTGVYLSAEGHILQGSPNQLYLILLGGMGGLLGSIIDSVLGATLQYSGLDEKSKSIVEIPGPNVKHISGIRLPYIEHTNSCLVAQVGHVFPMKLESLSN